MTREERVEILERIARGEETEEKMGKEGPSVVAVSVKDRLAALRMLAELEGEFERAKRAAGSRDDEDDYSRKSERQLRLELGLPAEEST